MCGIFGWQIKGNAGLPAGCREVLAGALATANSLRGAASWGMYFRKGQERTISKSVGDIADVSAISQIGHYNLVMAHTRYPTLGKVTKENAHPYEVGSIILAHNGMVYNHHDLDKKYNRSCEVDSMHLAHHMNEKLSFDEIEGYGAIEWVEKKHPDDVYLSRLNNGSLAVYGLKKYGQQVGTVWSSDYKHAEAAIDAARLDAYAYEDLPEGHVFQVSKGRLFKTERPKLMLKSRTYTYTSGSTDWRSQHRRWWKDEEVVTSGKKTTAIVVQGDDAKPSKSSKADPDVVKKYSVIWDELKLKRAPNGDFLDDEGHVLEMDQVEMLAEMVKARKEEEARNTGQQQATK